MEKQRKRAPSARSLQTKTRILDAAEEVFSERGFEAASLRDIATLAEVQVGLVHHHGGGKKELFHQTVARRAKQLSDVRVAALETRLSEGEITLRDILGIFLKALVALAKTEGQHWLRYGRLIAYVSSDERWKDLAADCFDPTANRFLDEILKLYPQAERHAAATGQVYSVAAMLAFLNTSWRIEALSPGTSEAQQEQLVDFCTGGFKAMLEKR